MSGSRTIRLIPPLLVCGGCHWKIQNTSTLQKPPIKFRLGDVCILAIFRAQQFTNSTRKQHLRRIPKREWRRPHEHRRDSDDTSDRPVDRPGRSYVGAHTNTHIPMHQKLFCLIPTATLRYCFYMHYYEYVVQGLDYCSIGTL